MTTLYLGIQSGDISLYRGLPRFFELSVLDAAGSPISLDPAATGKLIVTTSISPDGASVIHEFDDMYVTGTNKLRKDFSVADIAVIPLGAFFTEIQYVPPTGAPYPVAQTNLVVYPTVLG